LIRPGPLSKRYLHASEVLEAYVPEARIAALISQFGLDSDAERPNAARGIWTVGIRNPRNPTRALLAAELTDEAIATSGSHERGDHIWGSGPDGLASVSTIGSEIGTADPISTALFCSGGEDTTSLERFPDYEIVAVTHDLRVGTTPSARAFEKGRPVQTAVSL
jgi:thiamine biosynthesis lipoprotein ApbE